MVFNSCLFRGRTDPRIATWKPAKTRRCFTSASTALVKRPEWGNCPKSQCPRLLSVRYLTATAMWEDSELPAREVPLAVASSRSEDSVSTVWPAPRVRKAQAWEVLPEPGSASLHGEHSDPEGALRPRDSPAAGGGTRARSPCRACPAEAPPSLQTCVSRTTDRTSTLSPWASRWRTQPLQVQRQPRPTPSCTGHLISNSSLLVKSRIQTMA